MGRKLTALELIGPLLVLAAGAALVQGKELKFWVDNAGSCNIWAHGYSNSCRLSTTVVKAIGDIAAALGCRLDICKVTRCSSAETILADHLSQGRLRMVAGVVGYGATPEVIPKELCHWLAAPAVDDELGHRILKELALTMSIPSYGS